MKDSSTELEREFSREVEEKRRFEFGRNWQRFLSKLSEDRIAEAERSLCHTLNVKSLDGSRFIDIGSGSGLFSLAARRLGAKVFSFDYDPNSVACTRELRRRFFPDDPDWTIEHGSILEREYLKRLGTFEIVYSWGVLHHTGRMWEAIDNAASLVDSGGTFLLAIYNDQGAKTVFWTSIKRFYNRLPIALKPLFAFLSFLFFQLLFLLRYTIKLKPHVPIMQWLRYEKRRGMGLYVDWVDWVGGYPFEVSTPLRLEQHLSEHFRLLTVRESQSLGCNEFVFRRLPDDSSPS